MPLCGSLGKEHGGCRPGTDHGAGARTQGHGAYRPGTRSEAAWQGAAARAARRRDDHPPLALRGARRRPDLPITLLRKRTAAMQPALQDATVEGYEALMPPLRELGDDAHVAAAAVFGRADAIV